MSKIIHFPKTISIAFYSLVFLTLMKRKMNVEELASYTYSSKYHTAIILKNLAKHGYLRSSRGPDGGFGLDVKPEDISLLTVWEIVEGKFTIVQCLSDNKACIGEVCIFSDKIYNIHKELYEFLKTNSIKSLVERIDEGEE